MLAIMWRDMAVFLVMAGLVFGQRNDPGPGNHVDPKVEAALKEIFPLTSGVREDGLSRDRIARR